MLTERNMIAHHLHAVTDDLTLAADSLQEYILSDDPDLTQQRCEDRKITPKLKDCMRALYRIIKMTELYEKDM